MTDALQPSPQPSPQPQPPPLPAGRWLLAAVIAFILMLALGIWAGPWLRAGWQRLLPDTTAAAPHKTGDTAAPAGEKQWYISQMHPWIIQPEPGQCPICGMDLTPIDPKRFAAELSIDPATIQNIGVRTTPAVAAPLVNEVRTVGIVEWDPAKSRVIEPLAMGWVRTIAVAAAGDRVTQGEPVLTMYSPDLIAAQREWLATRALGEQAVAASTAKLRAVGLPDAAWEALRDHGTIAEEVTLVSPISGLVAEKMADPGDRIGPGMPALRLVNPDPVWVVATVYPHQLSTVVPGAAASIDIGEGEPIAAEVAYVEPDIDPVTRATRARLIVANPDLRLRAGRYATVRVRQEGGAPVVLIPRGAVRTTGERALIFVAQGAGRFEPREVTMGAIDNQGRVEIRSGLQAGEAVVVSGQFLLDSEARVKDAIARMIGVEVAKPAPSDASADIPPGEANAPDSADQAHVRTLIPAVLGLNGALLRSDASAFAAQREKLQTAIHAWLQADPEAPTRLVPLAALVQATHVETADHEAQRQLTGVIGVAMRDLLRATGLPSGRSLYLFQCGMADVAEDGWWIQTDDAVLNPYEEDMRTCGSVQPW